MFRKLKAWWFCHRLKKASEKSFKDYPEAILMSGTIDENGKPDKQWVHYPSGRTLDVSEFNG